MKADINLALFQISIILLFELSKFPMCSHFEISVFSQNFQVSYFHKIFKFLEFIKMFPSSQQIGTEENLGEE